jgi:hypothetical protein
MFVGLQYYVQWISFMLGSFVWCHHYVYDGDIIQLWKTRMKIANNKRTQIIFSGNSYRAGLNNFKSTQTDCFMHILIMSYFEVTFFLENRN